MPLPLISVIIPVHNVERYLLECLDSVRKQTFSKIEIICVNDSSTDGSLQILKQQASLDPRIRIVEHYSNLGLSAARNTGLKESNAPWIVFIDSDDIVSKHLCERCLRAAESHDSDVVFFNYTSFNDGDAHPAEPSPVEAQVADRKEMLLRNAFAWTKFARTDFLRSRKIEFPLGLCMQDIPVHWRLTIESARPIFLNEALVWYRQRPASISYRTDWTRADGFIVYDIVRNYIQLEPGAWNRYHEEFITRELEMFTDIYIKFAVSNRPLVRRAHEEITNRMTEMHWLHAMNSGALAGWRRDYIVSQCRPPQIAHSFRQLMPMIRHVSRTILRPIWRYIKRRMNWQSA